jgi:hypothetical protein
LDGTANSILGFYPYFTAYGVSNYNQDALRISQANFPDPRGIIDEIDIDESSIRTFMNMGTSLKEFKRDEAFLRRKKECAYTSSSITFPTTTLTGKVFSYKDAKSGTTKAFTFAGEASNVAALVSAMNTLIGATRVVAEGSDKINFVSPTGYFEVVEPASSSAHGIIGWSNGDKAYTLVSVDDADSDATTPFVYAERDNFNGPANSAQLTGTGSLSSPVALNTKTLQVQIDGAPTQEVIFAGDRIVCGSALNTSNTLNSKVLNLVVNGAAKVVTFTASSPVAIAEAIAEINAQAGAAVSYQSDSAGNYQAAGTYITFVLHETVYLAGSKPTAVRGSDVYLVYSGSTGWSDLGLTGTADLHQTLASSAVVAQINATMPGTASIVSNYLVLSSSDSGEESKIEIGNGTANTTLGFTGGQYATGTPFPVAVGDAVYADGAFIGNVAVVAPGGNSTKLKLDREVSTSAKYVYFYIEAKDIASPVPSDRPTPDLVVNNDGSISVKHDFARNTEGAPLEASGQLVIAYKALRLDVSASSDNPALLTIEGVQDINSALLPINTDNPLALMLYFMVINAPGVSVTGLGLDEISTSYPDGTENAYAKALTFLEKEEVYALAPGTQNPIVHQMFSTHVTSTSQPDSKGERVAVICPEMPGEAIPTIVESGTDGDYTGTANEFDTKLPTLSSSVLDAGLDPTGTLDADDGLFLDIASDSKRYNISAIDGTKITLRTAFAPGENDDGFFTTSSIPTTLISETFTIYKRGAELVTSTGDPDYAGISQAYQDLGKAYGNRRMVMVSPESVGAVIDSTEQKIPGYYAAAAIAGMMGQQAPQQGFTNFPITGFTKAIGSNDVFSASQMNVGAAGGTYWLVQNVTGGPLSCRHQLTTDLTSVETRELSITKVVDFVAKFMRAGLRNFIGKFNITQPFLDTLSSVVQGQLSFLTEAGVIVGGELNNIVQDSSAPDTVLIDVTLDVPYPCNYIRLALVI